MSDDKPVPRVGPNEATAVIGGPAVQRSATGTPAPVGTGTSTGTQSTNARTGNPDRTIQGVIISGRNRQKPDSMVPPEIARRARTDSAAPPSGVIAAGSTPRRRQPESGLLITGAPSEVSGVAWMPGQMPGPGVRIAHYELIREIGTGGMGTVFLARDLRLGRKVAIKILQAQHAELAQRFLVEARATARCHHENIVVIYEVGQVGDQPYMVLEYLKGQTLTDQITGGRRLSAARTLELVVPVVRALIAAHEQGIVHRDLKPDNIFVTDSGGIKVLDFGIAKIHERGADSSQGGGILVPPEQRMFTGDTALTRPGMIMGTVKYMSPEQWGIGVEIDHRTDIWAVGIILFRLLAGRHPLAPLQGNQLVATAMLDQPMPRLREIAPDVPPGIADIVDRCLYKLKDQRWANARELLKALEPYIPGRYTARELAGDESPYAGLASFQENDAGRFFGRTREIMAIVQRVRERPIVAVAGPSGVGKSSFVRAGLFPALKAAGEKWETLVIRPGRNPLAALAALTAPMVGGGDKKKQDGSSTTLVDDIKEQQDEITRLMREPGHLGMVLRSRARREKGKVLLFVDQFEELYTQVTDPKERLAFTAALASAADDTAAPVRVVVSLRSDFLDRVSEDPAFVAEVTQGMFFLATPSRDGLRDALVQPAEMAGYQFETPMMVDDMLAHLETTPGALPLLQFAATKLWEKRDNVQKLLTHSAYQSMGGIAGALATHADAVLAEMQAPQQTLTRALLLRLITPERTRAIVSLAELAELSPAGGEIQRLVDRLVSARLLVVSSTGEGGIGSTTIEIVHESLIHSWPALRRWLEETSEDAAFVDSIRVAAKQWHLKGRPTGLLWRGSEADSVRLWVKRGRANVLNDVQQAFVAAVITEATRAERRRSIITITAVTVLALLLVAAVGVALKIRQSEKRANDEAVARRAEAAAARKAEDEARTALKERLAAETAKAQAQTAQGVAEGDRDQAYRELEEKNNQLQEAITLAIEEQEKAKEEERKAEEAAELAKAAEAAAQVAAGEAKSARKEAERLYELEKQRRQKLEEQLGSPMVDTLK
jgi:serine/threonine protein kinase